MKKTFKNLCKIQECAFHMAVTGSSSNHDKDDNDNVKKKNKNKNKDKVDNGESL